MGGAAAAALAPVGWLFGLGTALRIRFARPRTASVPVICVGNLIAGGSGKTPVVIDLARRLKARGIDVHVVTRGYGGTVFGPHLVNAGDTAAAVGDEAVLLARAAPTWVADDRAKGVRSAVKEGAGAILFDDGFQDPSVRKDLSLLVIDGGFGFGNGRMIPAGPLRETVSAGMTRADAVVIIGDDEYGAAASVPTDMPLMRVVSGIDSEIGGLANKRLLAFAGIGRPDKFFASLRSAGLTLADTRAFADHHPYSAAELAWLRSQADALDATLVTTEKDFVRLSADEREGIEALSMSLTWPGENAIENLLSQLLAGDG